MILSATFAAPQVHVSIPGDTVIGGVRRKDPINVYRYRGFWLDLGRPSDFEAANREFEGSTSVAPSNLV